MDQVPLLLLLLVLSGFFSGAEIALFSLGREKVTALKNNAETKAELTRIGRLELLLSDSEKLLVTILIGNNVVNIAASAIATMVATNLAIESGYEGNQALVIAGVTGVMTFLILIFGEITPKSLAHKYAVPYSLFIAPVLSFLSFVLTPIVWPLAKLVKKFSGNKEVKHGLNEDELKAALELSEQEGEIDEDEKNWTEKILEMGEHSVEDIMTPRSKIFALEDDRSIKEALVEIQEKRFSRVPIYHEDLDHSVGILSVHGILEKMGSEDFWKQNLANLPLRAPIKIPTTMKIDTLLKEFQAEKSHMALVFDEFGGLVGLITMEDVLEEIFGEIQDEQDEEIAQIRRSGKDEFIFEGETEMEAIEDFILEDLETPPEKFPWNLEDENKTVGLFILEQIEKFPELNEQIVLETHDDVFTFTVVGLDEERIEEVELRIEDRLVNEN